MEEIKIPVRKDTITASPYKMQNALDKQKESTKEDIQKVMEQNNFTNQYLDTVGTQLDRIETLVRSEPRPDSKGKNKEINEPILKPFQPDENLSLKNDSQLLEEIEQHLKRLNLSEPTSSNPSNSLQYCSKNTAGR